MYCEQEKMGSTRPNTSSETQRTLVSAIQASEDLNAPTLRRLYALLAPPQLAESIPSSDSEHCSSRSGPGLDLGGLSVGSEEIRNLCGILFQELDFRFQVLFSALFDVLSSGEKAPALSPPEKSASVEELTLLLRCCLMLLTLDLVKGDVVLEKTRGLLRILDMVIAFVMRISRKSSVTFEKVVNRKSSFSGDAYTASVSEDVRAFLCILEPTDLFHPVLCAVLEVFADVLLLNWLLREYFLRVAFTSCTSRSVLGCDSLFGDLGTVTEVISVHFILSFSEGEEVFENFRTRLSCKVGQDLRVPELSLNAALSLLRMPAVLSAPKILQAHLCLLASEAIYVSLSSENTGLRSGFMGSSYLTVFGMSVSLYNGFMSSFLMGDHPIGWNGSRSIPDLFNRRFKSFPEWHMQEITRARMDDLVKKADSLWGSEQVSVFDKAKSQLMAHSIMYISESLVEERYKSDMFPILNSIVLGAFSDSFMSDIVHQKMQRNPRHIYFLASIVKLMSTSLSAIVSCLGHETMEYDSILSIIGTFQHYNVSLPHQKKLLGSIQTHLTRHLSTKWMLLHFSGLLSLCFASGHDFLVDNCISTMLVLMDLYVFEEGTIEAMRSVLGPGSESFSSQDKHHKLGEANDKSCRNIAVRIQKIQAMCSSSECPETVTCRTASTLRLRRGGCASAIEEETGNGKVFVDCLLKGSSKPERDDLADFIECTPGKDYASWLKDKDKYRKWKSKKKKALLKWKKKKSSLILPRITYQRWKKVEDSGKVTAC